MAVFLTEEWFDKIEQLSADAGDLNLPPSLANMVLNLKVSDGADVQEASLSEGMVTRGLNDAASTTLLLDKATLESLFKDFDMNSAMGAFMSGKIRVEGDMSQLMALQTAQPSDEQKALLKKIQSMTEFA